MNPDLLGLKTGGTYVLWLHLPAGRSIDVGRLGRFAFAAGDYAYVGSAFAAGGLAARVGRHLRGGRRLRWHIDYLRQTAEPAAVWWTRSSRRHEHQWAAILAQAPGAWIPAPRFGASDCGCRTHLTGHPSMPDPVILPGCQGSLALRAIKM